MPTKIEIEDEIIRILRALRSADRERHTMLARDLAATMVALREHYLTPEGRPDWTGRNWQYRDAVRNIYGRADYTAEERATTQTSVRYHIGNLIRQHLSPAELEAAGITAPSPHARQAGRRRRASTILAALAPDTTTADAPLADKVAELRTVLATLSVERVKKHTLALPENAEAADALARLLEAIRDRAASLLGEVERARA